jgi:hypothetical protein
LPLHPKNLHHLVAQVVDDFDGNSAGLGFGEGAGSVAVQRFPGLGVDFGLERRPESAVRVVLAEEIGVANEETLFVVVGVDEPAGDSLGAVAADFARVGMKHVDSLDLHPKLAVLLRQHVDVGFAEDDKQIALARILEILGHVQVGVHARLEHRDAAELVEFGRVGVEVERAGDQHVKARVPRLARGEHQVLSLDGAEFGTDEDGRSPLGFSLKVTPLGADILARPGNECREGNSVFLVRLLDPLQPLDCRGSSARTIAGRRWFSV